MSLNIQEQFQKMALGERIILVAGPLLFIDGFLPWYDLSGVFNRSGWQAPGALWSILAILLGLTMAGLVAAVRFGNVKIPELPQGVTWARLMLGLGGAAAVFVVIKFLNHSGDIDFGFVIGALLVAALAGGGFLMYQEEQQGEVGGGGADAGPTRGGGPGPTGGGDAGAGGGASPAGGGEAGAGGDAGGDRGGGTDAGPST